MFQTLKNAWHMPELRKKILYTLFILLIFRFGSCIPVPFINTDLLAAYFEQASVSGSMLGYLNMFTGGGLSTATIFAMSITLYINRSIILVLLAPIGMAAYSATEGRALNYSLEFVGGTSTTVTFPEDMDVNLDSLDTEVKPVVEEVTGDANVQFQQVVGSNQVIIKTRTLDMTEREAFAQKMEESFDVPEDQISAETISSTVSKEMQRDAILAVTIATVCMLIYIWFRFKDIRFASSGVLALLHDVMVVLACYTFVRISVGNTFIACMLTILGYSINATIVIFDRIRENMHGVKTVEELKELVNASITQTLTRSIYTSLTTFITIAVLFVMGVSTVREFALPIMTGIVCGAYSSVCITGPLWFTMKKRSLIREK